MLQRDYIGVIFCQSRRRIRRTSKSSHATGLNEAMALSSILGFIGIALLTLMWLADYSLLAASYPQSRKLAIKHPLSLEVLHIKPCTFHDPEQALELQVGLPKDALDSVLGTPFLEL